MVFYVIPALKELWIKSLAGGDLKRHDIHVRRCSWQRWSHILFYCCSNGALNKQSSWRWFETPWHSCVSLYLTTLISHYSFSSVAVGHVAPSGEVSRCHVCLLYHCCGGHLNVGLGPDVGVTPCAGMWRKENTMVLHSQSLSLLTTLLCAQQFVQADNKETSKVLIWPFCGEINRWPMGSLAKGQESGQHFLGK